MYGKLSFLLGNVKHNDKKNNNIRHYNVRFMKTTEINNINELLDCFGRFRKSSIYKFRGQSNKEWDLIPKAGRSPFNNRNDKDLFDQWKRRAIAYLERENYNEWELLAISQHHGIPTRLLDWTHNPLVAAFFACIDNFDLDGAVYIYKPDGFIDINSSKPFGLTDGKVKFFQPTASSDRIMNQFGYFSIHTKPKVKLDETYGVLEKIIIPLGIKKEIIFALNQFGVNNLTIFPDLEGLSKHLIWFYTNYEYWDGTEK